MLAYTLCPMHLMYLYDTSNKVFSKSKDETNFAMKRSQKGTQQDASPGTQGGALERWSLKDCRIPDEYRP